jgi:polar amino acid transport system substrate-binding protein
MRRFAHWLLIVSSAAARVPAPATELAPTGTLRATFLAQNPVQGRIDPASGAVSGPAAELGAELARRLGVPFSIAGLPGVPAVIDSVKTGAADIGFLARDPARAAEVDFSQPYELAHNTYLVLDRSAIRGAADIDRAGVRIGVGAGDAADLYLRRTLKNAELVPNPGGSLALAYNLLVSSGIDAYAANRQRLSEFAPTQRGLRILPDNFLPVEQAIIVKKGDVEGLATINRLIDEARRSGLIQAAIERAKLVGVDVAPPPVSR